MIACSISDPEKPSVATASCSRLKSTTTQLRLRRWMEKISLRTAGSGKSTKKISSSRPLRINSGGKREMSLLVATINTRVRRSAIQVNKVPSKRCDTPLSLPSCAMPFSISSSHSTQGDMASASFNASRKLRSVSPWNLL